MSHPSMSSQESSSPPPKANTAEILMRNLTLGSFVSLGDKEKSRPPISYPKLIKEAISQAPNRRLLVAEIYKWISDKFTFYDGPDTRWKNSIRWNLTAKSAFARDGRYWTIQPDVQCRTKKFQARHRGDRPALTSMATDPPRINPQPPIPDMPSDTTPTSTDSFVRKHRGSSYPSIPTTSPAAALRSLPQVRRYISISRPTSPDISSSRSSSHKRTSAPLDKGDYGRQAKRVRFFSRGRAEEAIAQLRRSQYLSGLGSGGTSSGPTCASHTRQTSGWHISRPFTPPVSPQPPTEPNTAIRLHLEEVQEKVARLQPIAASAFILGSPANGCDMYGGIQQRSLYLQ